MNLLASMIDLMDKTILSAISIMLTSAGLYVVLTKYHVPEINMGFFSENPFLRKREIIEKTMTGLFTSIVIIGQLLQMASLLLDSTTLGDRKHNELSYAAAFALFAMGTALLCYLLSRIGSVVARRGWYPYVINSQRELYAQSKQILDNGGWRNDQISGKTSFANSEELIIANLQTVDQNLTKIEKLLELQRDCEDRALRLERLKKHFG